MCVHHNIRFEKDLTPRLAYLVLISCMIGIDVSKCCICLHGSIHCCSTNMKCKGFILMSFLQGNWIKKTFNILRFSISWITIKRNWLYAWFVRKIVNEFDVASHFKLLLFTKMLHMTYLIIFIASISLWRLYKWEKIYFYRLRLMSLHRNSFQSSMRNSHFLMILYVVNLQFFLPIFIDLFWIRITTIFQ